jgi:hypothetical protein
MAIGRTLPVSAVSAKSPSGRMQRSCSLSRAQCSNYCDRQVGVSNKIKPPTTAGFGHCAREWYQVGNPRKLALNQRRDHNEP